MPVQAEAYHRVLETLPSGVTLVAVSKTKPLSDIQALYDLGHRDFGENYVQELLAKQPALPRDIRWHFIGHLQSNKVKFLASFVHLIHGVDSFSLLKEISKQGAKAERVLDCLLQVHIAREETKFGFSPDELPQVLAEVQGDAGSALAHARIRGLMGMASNDRDEEQVRSEFQTLRGVFQHYQAGLAHWDTLSMGMSQDYKVAVECGTTMVRIGSLLFGSR
jgi:PLP dependent protein